MKSSVSIIIPNFNRGSLLLEAIESCFQQTGVEVDVIIIDDGSTDGSADIAKAEFPLVRLIKQKNQGACIARNAGMEAAIGDYIKFIDSDDKLKPNHLSKQIRKARDSKADVVYGDFEMFGTLDDPRIGGQPIRIAGEIEDPVSALLGDWWCAPFSYLIRTKALQEIRWNPSLSCLQDFDFILRVALSGARFAYQPGITGYYRMHNGQITNSSALAYAKNRCCILDETVETLQKNNKLTTHKKNLIAHGYWTSARSFYHRDPVNFSMAVSKVYEMSPRFSPSFWGPFPVRALTTTLGIRSAERILGMRRNIMCVLKGAK